MSSKVRGVDKFTTEFAYPPELQAHLDAGGALDWSGDTYVDSMAVGANATAKIYPDGTIVGSTDNGVYTKNPDGSIHVSSTTVRTVVTSEAHSSGYYGDSADFPLPVKFISGNFTVALSPTVYVNTMGYTLAAYAANTATNPTWSFRGFSHTNGGTVGARVSIAGRWK